MTNYAASRRIDRRVRAGFSLIELLIVLVLMGLISKIAISKVNSARYKADASVQLLRTTLQSAQRTALVRQHDIIISFDTTGQRIRMIWDANNDGIASVGEQVRWVPLSAGDKFSVPVKRINGTAATKSITGPQVRTMNAMPTVTFHREGALSTDVEVYLMTPGSKGIKEIRGLVVTMATGRSDWYRENATPGGGYGAWRLGAL